MSSKPPLLFTRLVFTLCSCLDLFLVLTYIVHVTSGRFLNTCRVEISKVSRSISLGASPNSRVIPPSHTLIGWTLSLRRQ